MGENVCSSDRSSGRAERQDGGGAITGSRSPNVVQYGPDPRQNGGAGQTKDQHEPTRFTTPLNLQNLHPRFKSGRRLQNFSENSIVWAFAARTDAFQLDYGGLQIVIRYVVRVT